MMPGPLPQQCCPPSSMQTTPACRPGCSSQRVSCLAAAVTGDAAAFTAATLPSKWMLTGCLPALRFVAAQASATPTSSPRATCASPSSTRTRAGSPASRCGRSWWGWQTCWQTPTSTTQPTRSTGWAPGAGAWNLGRHHALSTLSTWRVPFLPQVYKYERKAYDRLVLEQAKRYAAPEDA